jgi:hypothetical protein
MKAIVETTSNERFLEFVLTESEIKLMLRYHLISCKVTINNREYQVGIRIKSPSEDMEED